MQEKVSVLPMDRSSNIEHLAGVRGYVLILAGWRDVTAGFADKLATIYTALMDIADMLIGGDPRSLGNAEQVVTLVLAVPTRLGELFECAFHPDVTVRMRAGDALEKICRQQPEWFQPFKERIFSEWSQSTQPSLQWHLAQILSEISLTPTERERAAAILLQNLAATDDWIVTNLTLEALASFVRQDALDRQRFVALLKPYQVDRHKSVVSKASKLLKEFDDG